MTCAICAYFKRKHSHPRMGSATSSRMLWYRTCIGDNAALHLSKILYTLCCDTLGGLRCPKRYLKMTCTEMFLKCEASRNRDPMDARQVTDIFSKSFMVSTWNGDISHNHVQLDLDVYKMSPFIRKVSDWLRYYTLFMVTLQEKRIQNGPRYDGNWNFVFEIVWTYFEVTHKISKNNIFVLSEICRECLLLLEQKCGLHTVDGLIYKLHIICGEVWGEAHYETILRDYMRSVLQELETSYTRDPMHAWTHVMLLATNSRAPLYRREMEEHTTSNTLLRWENVCVSLLRKLMCPAVSVDASFLHRAAL